MEGRVVGAENTAVSVGSDRRLLLDDARVGVAMDEHRKSVLLRNDVRHVEAAPVESAVDASHELSVEEDVSLPVDAVEIEYESAALEALRQGERVAVPEITVEERLRELELVRVETHIGDGPCIQERTCDSARDGGRNPAFGAEAALGDSSPVGLHLRRTLQRPGAPGQLQSVALGSLGLLGLRNDATLAPDFELRHRAVAVDIQAHVTGSTFGSNLASTSVEAGNLLPLEAIIRNLYAAGRRLVAGPENAALVERSVRAEVYGQRTAFPHARHPRTDEMLAGKHRNLIALIVKINFSHVPLPDSVSVERDGETTDAAACRQGSHIGKLHFGSRTVARLDGLGTRESFEHRHILASATLVDGGTARLQRQLDCRVVVSHYHSQPGDETLRQAGTLLQFAVTFERNDVRSSNLRHSYHKGRPGLAGESNSSEIIVEKPLLETVLDSSSIRIHTEDGRRLGADDAVGGEMSGQVVVSADRMPGSAVKRQVAVAVAGEGSDRTVILLRVARINSDAP